MSAVAAVVERAVAVATITTTRGTSAAVVRERTPVATVADSQGPAGPPGPAGVAAAILYTRPSPAATWTIPHTLGRRPLVQVADDSGEIVFPDVIAGPAAVTIVFAHPTTGSAILF